MPQAKLLDDKIKPKRSGRKKAKIPIGEISKENVKASLTALLGPLYVGLDTHKRTIQVSVMTPGGTEVSNGSIPNTAEAVRKSIGSLPKDCKLVMESSSVWTGSTMSWSRLETCGHVRARTFTTGSGNATTNTASTSYHALN